MIAYGISADGPGGGSPSEDAAAPESARFEVSPEWRARVSGTLINPDTLLATDYLNHFNEAAMIIGMVADIPEMLTDLEAWQPRGYADHFRAAGLDYGDLAAEAYEHAPAGVKGPFEAVVAQIERAVMIARRRIAARVAAGDLESLRELALTSSATLTALIGTAGGIIAGGRYTLSQEDVDRLEMGENHGFLATRSPP